jgi:hypothetical protein
MRERYQADQTPPPSVAEQLVAENKPQPMQMGLGAMAPQGMMPTPAPAPEMDPRQLAASGIAANPVSNVGSPAMMAKGGIVGEVTNKMGKSNPVYEDGSIGALAGLAVPPVTSAVLGLGSLLGRGVMGAGRYLGNKMSPLFGPAGTKIAPSTTTGTTLPAVITPNALAPTVPTVAGYLRQPGALIDLGALGALGYGVSQLGDGLGPEDKKEETEKPKGEPGGEPTQKGMTLEDYVEEYNKAMGENESITRAKERLADRRDSAANMALIEAGLNIAAGESPDALTNIAKGATTGVQGYTESLKEMDALDLAIGQAERAERLAAVNFGMQSIEARRAAEQKAALMQQKAQLEAYYASMTVKPETRRKIMVDLEDSNFYTNFDKMFADTEGENAIGGDKYKRELAKAIELEVARRSLPMGNLAGTSSQFKFLGSE